MKKRHSAEQIVAKLRQADVVLGQGRKGREVCRQLGNHAIRSIDRGERQEAGLGFRRVTGEQGPCSFQGRVWCPKRRCEESRNEKRAQKKKPTRNSAFQSHRSRRSDP